ncbi:MAG: hypothetical protein ACYDEY_07340 [Acidimicrobiales bacterium]
MTAETKLALAMGLALDCQQACRRGGRYNQAFSEAIYVNINAVSYNMVATPFHQLLPPEITERVKTTENHDTHRRGGV